MRPVICRFCDRELPTAAPQQVMAAQKAARQQGRWILAAVAILAVFGIAAILNSRPSSNSRTLDLTGAHKHDSIHLLLQRFGQPDADYSSANEKPCPPMVTRTLIYNMERVRAVDLAQVDFGAPLPNNVEWHLIGFSDPQENVGLSPEVAIRRLSKRPK